MKETEYDIIRRLKRSYIIALLGIALLVTASCTILIIEIYRQQKSSRIINISGRQRMLSQNIIKNLLLLNGSYPTGIYAESRRELAENYASWTKAHNALLHGDISLDIPKQKLSTAISTYFQRIEPYYRGIAQTCQVILEDNGPRPLQEQEIITLLQNERNFLQLMDRITFQFDAEAKEGATNLIRYEILFLLFTFLTLFLEAWFIFRPINILVHKTLMDYNALFEEKKLQELESLNAIVEAQENERQRIASDLHEGIAQMLSLVKINLSAVEDASNEKKKQVIISLEKLVDHITAELKNVSYNLMPSTLSQFGLVPALEELVEKMQYNDQLAFRLEKNTDRSRFGDKTDVNIYRIVQELVNNTLKHAGATEMALQLTEHEDDLTIIFKNNGGKFDAAMEQKNGGKGLKNIISHTRNINGTINFDTIEEGKIIITLKVPVTEI